MELETISDDYVICHYRDSRINVRRQPDGTWRATAKIPGTRNWRVKSPCRTQDEAIRIVCFQIDCRIEADRERLPVASHFQKVSPEIDVLGF